MLFWEFIISLESAVEFLSLSQQQIVSGLNQNKNKNLVLIYTQNT